MSYEYMVQGQMINLKIDEDCIAVRFKEPAFHSMRARVTEAIGDFTNRFEVPGEKYTIIPVAQTRMNRLDRHATAFREFSSSPEVVHTTPVFKMGNNRLLATDRILIGFKPDVKKDMKIFADHQCEVIGNSYDGEYLLKIPEMASPFDLINEFSSMSVIEYAEPDFVIIGRHMVKQMQPPALIGSDPLSSKQYVLEITQALEAWNLLKGIPDIKIAVIDEGVDTNHEDLKDAIVATYDAVDDDTFQEPNSWDGHGTCCAGLAAAIPNNNKGIHGIGGGCSLIPIRIAYSNTPHSNWITRDSWIQRGIDWAWEKGKADILSNSWGGGACSTAIINAFNRARTNGRDGKGCIVVIAAGNEDGPVNFPGNIPEVLTVSASNEYDEPKTKTSRDGENWWGSSYGPEVDIAAPGVHNYTTDIMSQGGYSTDNYYAIFNGTSSATPIVAGAVGLVLSANSNLQEADVRKIIVETADKVGPIPYFGGRNDRMGCGRLNVLKAVKKAAQASLGAA